MTDALTPQDLDLMTRTIVGEAGSEPDDGQAAVAHVILNRVAKGTFGATPSDVVMAPSQFEPTGNPSSPFYSTRPGNPEYQKASKILSGVLSGDIPDPTNGATNFYAPVAQRAMGRQPPNWANGVTPSAMIGGHVFYAPNGSAPPSDQITQKPPQADNDPAHSMGSTDLPALAYAAATPSPAPAPSAVQAVPAAASAQGQTMPAPAQDNAAFAARWGVDPSVLNGMPSAANAPDTSQSDADYIAKLASKISTRQPEGVSYAPAGASAQPAADPISASNAAYLAALAPKTSALQPDGVTYAPAGAPAQPTADPISPSSAAYLASLLPPSADHAAFAKRWGVDPAVLSSPGPSVPTDSQTLVETPEGGRDPKTGALVRAGKPFTQPTAWNGLVNAANGALQGLGVNLGAAANAARPDAPADGYAQAETQLEGARAAYAKDNPATALATEIGGSAATMIPGMALAGAPIAAGAARLTSAAPALEGAVNFLAGNAGRAASVLDAAGNAVQDAGGRMAMYGGNLLMRGASLATNGAAQGAAAGALGSNLNDGSVAQNAAGGAALGAGLGAGAPLVNKLMTGAGSAARGLYEPFTRSGQSNIADRVIAEFAKGGPTASNAAELVPGSTPTLAQATANPGIASMERAVRDVRPNAFGDLDAGNSEMRNMLFDGVKGDATTLDSLKSARDAAAAPLRQQAFANSVPVSPQPVIDTIDQILASPSGQRDSVVTHLNDIKAKMLLGKSTMPNGSTINTLQNDPAQLYGIRQALTDSLSPLARADGKPSAQLAAKELGAVKDSLDGVIEQGAPGYGGYLKTFADMSKPIDTQGYLQKLNVTDASGNLTLGRVDSALKNIEKQRAAAGVQDAKSIPDDTMTSLYNLRDDLRRKGNSSLGKSIGSNTFQNLATNNLMGNMSAPLALFELPHNPLASIALRGGKMMYGSQNGAILDQLANKLMTPSMPTSAAFRGATKGGPGFNLAPSMIAGGVGYHNNRFLAGVPPAGN